MRHKITTYILFVTLYIFPQFITFWHLTLKWKDEKIITHNVTTVNLIYDLIRHVG